VNVFVTRRLQGYQRITKLGTVNAGTTGEFDLAAEDENRLQFEWAQGAAGQDSQRTGSSAVQDPMRDPTLRFVDAPTRNRTENLLIKSQLLYQLSYRRAGGNIAIHNI
jgi:hypothetical protein